MQFCLIFSKNNHKCIDTIQNVCYSKCIDTIQQLTGVIDYEKENCVMSNYDELDREFLLDALEDRYGRETLEEYTTEELQTFYEEDTLEEFCEGELENFKSESLTTKEQLLSSIKKCREEYAQAAASQKPTHSLAFYEILDALLEKFYWKLRSTTLPEPLPDWWSYSYKITAAGIQLSLDHYDWSGCGNDFSCWHGERLTLLEIPARRLTVSEFAKLYGIEVVTVRQWIRRGKIRSAIKFGKEWRIPELAELSRSRNYTACRYNWTEDLTDLPEKFAYINQFKSALFQKDWKTSDQYIIALDLQNADDRSYMSNEELIAKRHEILGHNKNLRLNDSGEILMTRKDREELELYMISNPLIYFQPGKYESYLDACIDEIGNNYCPSFMSVTVS